MGKKILGFTLLELLVVIAILGLIATIAIAAFQGANVRARDAKRQADIIQLGKAGNLYLEANNGNYPLPSGWGSNTLKASSFYDGGWATLMPNELSQMPKDPQNGLVTGIGYSDSVNNFQYIYAAPGATTNPSIGNNSLDTGIFWAYLEQDPSNLPSCNNNLPSGTNCTQPCNHTPGTELAVFCSRF